MKRLDGKPLEVKCFFWYDFVSVGHAGDGVFIGEGVESASHGEVYGWGNLCREKASC